MKFFYLSSKPEPSGEYLVHQKDCLHIPEILERDYLGPFNSGAEALRKARSIQAKAACCPLCCAVDKVSIIKASNSYNSQEKIG
jgi:hypothetical protein